MNHKPHKHSFFKRHSRALPLIGTVIVFLTFVAKEGLAVRWKEQASAVDLAQYVYSIRADATQLTLALDFLGNRGRGRNNLQDARSRDPERKISAIWSSLDILVEIERARLTCLESDLSNVAVLLDKLPETPEVQKQLAELEELRRSKVQLDAIWKSITRRMEMLSWPTTVRRNSSDSSHSETLSAVSRLNLEAVNFAVPYVQTSTGAKKLISEVLAEAERTRKQSEIRSNYAWWIAAAFYTLGLSLAVVGRLHDVAVTTSE